MQGKALLPTGRSERRFALLSSLFYVAHTPVPPDIGICAPSLGTNGQRSSLGYAAWFTKNCNPNMLYYKDF